MPDGKRGNRRPCFSPFFLGVASGSIEIDPDPRCFRFARGRDGARQPPTCPACTFLPSLLAAVQNWLRRTARDIATRIPRRIFSGAIVTFQFDGNPSRSPFFLCANGVLPSDSVCLRPQAKTQRRYQLPPPIPLLIASRSRSSRFSRPPIRNATSPRHTHLFPLGSAPPPVRTPRTPIGSKPMCAGRRSPRDILFPEFGV